MATKRIIGISAYYHDSAATLIVDGQVVAAAQEERFTRRKHDPDFPMQAIEYCLQEAACNMEEIDAVIFYDKPMLKFERLLETFLAHAPWGFSSFVRAMPIWLKEKLYLKSVLRQELRRVIHRQRARNNGTTEQQERKLQKRPEIPQLLFSEHHQSHAASAFYPSPFEKAVVLCLDGVGEWATSTAWLGEGRHLRPLWEIQFPHSLGLLYSAFTYYCGFKVNSGEYKLMGLAPYGEPIYVDTILEHLLDVQEDGSFALNMQYFDYAIGRTMINSKFEALFGGPAKSPDAEVSQKEMDLARSIQVVTEEIVLKIANYAHQQTGCEHLCMAGGVALNCVANGRILREGPFKHLWIQPAAGDAGGSLGAAYVAWHQFYQQDRLIKNDCQDNSQASKNDCQDNSQTSKNDCQENGGLDVSRDSMAGAYLGPEYSDEQIQQYLDEQRLPYVSIATERLYDVVAEYLDQGKVIGWFQGRMEFGPRALGNRSIIGDPRNTQMQSQMNVKIKQRESFRPFAPAVLAERVSDYFEINCPSPYMLLVAQVQNGLLKQGLDANAKGLDKLHQVRSTIPAITHVDFSARVQTVHQHTNERFYQLLKAFERLTGEGVLINTSFNVRGEPPVCSPADAVRCFLATDMDILVMNHQILMKSEQPAAAIDQAKQITFAMD